MHFDVFSATFTKGTISNFLLVSFDSKPLRKKKRSRTGKKSLLQEKIFPFLDNPIWKDSKLSNDKMVIILVPHVSSILRYSHPCVCSKEEILY